MHTETSRRSSPAARVNFEMRSPHPKVKPMTTPLHRKSTVDEIRERFDQDVERFSDLVTGQVAVIDAPLTMELITQAAARVTPHVSRVLDVGCGAGNNTLKLREVLQHDFDVDLLDLSQPMLDRAFSRISAVNGGHINRWQSDLRDAPLEDNAYNVILAAAVLHHLRDDRDWEREFARLYSSLAPGGSLWITDMVCQETAPVHELMWERYGEYLSSIGGDEYRQRVFAYIDREDSPRSVTYQLELLSRVGFEQVELLHKNSCFAAFGAVKRI